jgi:hypothetical protein
LTIRADADPNIAYNWQWHFPRQLYCSAGTSNSSYSTVVNVGSSTAGTYNISAEADPSGACSDVSEVHICEVSELMGGDFSYGPLYIPLNTPIDIYANSNPTYNYRQLGWEVYFPPDFPTWDVISYPSGADQDDVTLVPGQSYIIVGGGNDKLTFTASVPGEYIIQAQAGSSDVGKQIRIIVFDLRLFEVSYDGTKIHPILIDGSTSAYGVPQWKDNTGNYGDGDADDQGDIKYPICFTSGTTMSLTAKWHINSSDGTIVKIKGDGPDGLSFEETEVTVSNYIITISNKPCSNPFASSTVRFYNPMEINWKISFYDGSTWSNWIDAGTSKNPTYITLADPVTGMSLYYTSVHLACSEADTKTDPDECVSEIWGVFSSLNVQRVNGTTSLTFWKDANTQASTTKDLLTNGDGQCGAWSDFLMDILKVHGISSTKYLV